MTVSPGISDVHAGGSSDLVTVLYTKDVSILVEVEVMSNVLVTLL